MADKYKKNDGNKYAHNPDYAEEVLAKNAKQMAPNNPRDGVRK